MKHFFYIFWCFFFFSCHSQSTIEFLNTNLNKEKTYFFDYENAFQYGFKIPSIKKDKIDYFQVSFKIPSNLKNEELYYKILYQNETYKFPEVSENGASYNELSQENFYGSWENTTTGFRPINKNNDIVVDSFLIQGNPRNESLYINENSRNRDINEKEIAVLIQQIKSTPEWLNGIEVKAKESNRSLDQQLFLDASWMLSQKVNNRWQRNPRVGDYSLLVVVVTKNALDSIPDYIKNIELQNNGIFVNPYFYFLHGDGSKNKNIKTLFIDKLLTLKASVPLNNGFYIPESENFLSKEYYNKYVNDSKEMYKNATFTYHDTYRSDSIKNLPIKTDFFKENFSILDYKNNQKKYDSSERITTWLGCDQYPGKNFGYDKNEDFVWFKNPGSVENEYKKENLGFKTRHGLTYGKYTFKIKMCELLNKQGVWTGLTNAIWMLWDTPGPWNNRRGCVGDGYYPYYVTKDSKKEKQTFYSEIDFEIVKAAEFWPKWDYKDPEKERVEPESHKDKVMVACTNWDMSCAQPTDFDDGVHLIKYQNKTYDLHRWASYKNAVTSKVPELDDELFGGEYYYFQLEWKPTEIIWRIGPEKNNLHIVGYMNDKVTSIPNNQMITVFTQEYHYSHWWPNAPFLQEDIPFPKGDLNGKLYSIEIE